MKGRQRRIAMRCHTVDILRCGRDGFDRGVCVWPARRLGDGATILFILGVCERICHTNVVDFYVQKSGGVVVRLNDVQPFLCPFSGSRSNASCESRERTKLESVFRPRSTSPFVGTIIPGSAGNLLEPLVLRPCSEESERRASFRLLDRLYLHVLQLYPC